MARRSPNDIGTHGATAVVRYLRTAGFPQAERRALHGHTDLGDITGTPGICWQSKVGKYAKAASDNLIAAWLDECMAQTVNAGADVGVLVVARAGIGEANAGRWWGIMPGWQYARLAVRAPMGIIGGVVPPLATHPIRMHLAQACAVLTHAGYGTAPAIAEVA